MISTALRRGACLAALMLAIACGETAPTSPTAAIAPAPVLGPGQPPPRNFPPLSGPSRTFTFDHELTYRVSDYTKHSRFVLYDTGGFLLQYTSLTGDGYRGGYTEAGGLITFEWEGWNIGGPWGATATIQNGTLTVRYNDIMLWSDFEDAVYRLTPSP
jgi:hypothetical protein